MKSVKYQLRKDLSIELLEQKLKQADIGLAIGNEEEDHINVEFYSLDKEELTAEEILMMGTLIGLIEFLTRLETR
jgi:hypothetical protein